MGVAPNFVARVSMTSFDKNEVDIPAGMRQRISPGESLLWTGRPPQQLFLFRSTEWFLMPISIGWGALTVLLFISILNAPAPNSAADVLLIGIDALFAAVGVYLAAGRFFMDFVRRRHTWYAVTSMRVLIFQDFPAQRMRSLYADQLGSMRLDEGFGDVGTIRFPGGNETVFYLMGGNESWPWAAGVAPPSFERIHDARRVYELIREEYRTPHS